MDDPRELIAKSPMSTLQILVIAVTVALNALDGFDAQSISFASPGIAQQWGIDRGALGVVLSMEVIGMAIGSLFLGGVADKIGRRRTVLGCTVVMKARCRWSRTLPNDASTFATRSATPTRPLMLEPHRYGMIRKSQPSEFCWDGADCPNTLGTQKNRQSTAATTK